MGRSALNRLAFFYQTQMMDLIFAKAKGRTAGLTFNRFLYTLAMIAQSKQTTYLSVCRKLVLNSMMHVMEKHEKTAMTRVRR